MAGHSKWANIKHRKAAQDKKRGKIWSKLIREVTVAAREAGATIEEYAPREIKLAVTGSGAATKERVAFMVRAILNLPDLPPPDAADALATALCHLHRCGLRTSP